jgi:2-dehydropantoate 2-reductase
MKVLVYGAGVVGTLYGGKLAHAGHHVTVVARGRRLLDIGPAWSRARRYRPSASLDGAG